MAATAAGAGASGGSGGVSGMLSSALSAAGLGFGSSLGGATPAGPAISGLGGGINVTVAPPQFAPQPQPTLPSEASMPGAVPLYPVGLGTTPAQPFSAALWQPAPGQTLNQFRASQGLGSWLPLVGLGLLVTAVVKKGKG